MTNSQPRQPAGRPVGGQFADRERIDGEVSLNPFAALTPAGVDEGIAAAYVDLRPIRVNIWHGEDDLKEYEQRDLVRERAAAIGRPLFSSRFDDPDGTKRAKAQERVDRYRAEFDTIYAAEVAPREAEFNRRGGWNRFFLVTSSNGGHVHNSMSCSTCNPRTQFIWLHEESGKNEAQIVEKAGDGACTVCFPSAPVADKANPRPNPYEDPDVTARRAERDAAKRARDEKARAVGVFMPDGSPLAEAPMRSYVDGHTGKERRGYSGQVIKTERTAETFAQDIIDRYPTRKVPELAADAWNRDYFTALAERDIDTLDRILTGLALKHGTDEQAELDRLTAKAAARAKNRR